MDYTNVKQDDKTLNFLTGILSDLLFQWILSLIRSDGPSILKSGQPPPPNFDET